MITIIERVEKINEDVSALAADMKEIFAEAKSAGFDPKYIRQMVRLRKLDPDELSETGDDREGEFHICVVELEVE